MTTLLIVDDDDDLRTMLRIALEDERYRVVDAEDAERALYELSRHAVDAVLVDIRLPGMNGLELCREIRRRSRVPVVAVTAQAESEDMVAVLDAGADDYVAKPIKIPELVARLRSVLRRARGDLAPGTRVRAGDLLIDLSTGLVERGAQPIPLTPVESRLLAVLAERLGVMVRREELLERVWGPDRLDDLRIVDVHIERLRAKIEAEADHGAHLVAIPGMGYQLVP